MRYKVGNEVMLRDDLVVYKPYKGAVYTEVLNTLADEPIRINWLNKKNKTYYVTGGNVISCDMIDHEKTAELKEERYRQQMYEIQQQENEAEGYTVEEKTSLIREGDNLASKDSLIHVDTVQVPYIDAHTVFKGYLDLGYLVYLKPHVEQIKGIVTGGHLKWTYVMEVYKQKEEDI